MFYSLTGNIVYYDQQFVAIQCGGVAYKCTVSLNTLSSVHSSEGEVTLFTYLAVREDSVELFGFKDNEELEFFKLLISVSGVGPKAAMSVLSTFTPASLSLCIASGDVKAISKAQGIGAKTAQRIVLELKDKTAKIAPSVINSKDLQTNSILNMSGNISEAISALSVLGFSQSDASKALSGADSSMNVEELIKFGLKILSKGV